MTVEGVVEETGIGKETETVVNGSLIIADKLN